MFLEWFSQVYQRDTKDPEIRTYFLLISKILAKFGAAIGSRKLQKGWWTLAHICTSPEAKSDLKLWEPATKILYPNGMLQCTPKAQ